MKMKYPNLQLYKDLKPCEDDLFDLINKNFLIIDSYWMLRIISIVDELPGNPSQGDTYIINDSIALFDGMEWSFTGLKDGMYFYILSEHDFFYYDDGLKSFGEKYGNVTGPEVSLNNSVAIFDGTTGKFITDSNVFIEDGNVLISETIYGENIYGENGEIDNLAIEDSLTIGLNEFDGDGEDAEIPDERGIQFILTNNNLESISKINKTDGNLLTLLNITGKSVVIKNGSGIITGTEEDIDLNNEASILLQRFGEEWYIVGGTGSGSGSITVVQDMTDLTSYPDEKRKDGMLFYVASEKMTFQLSGGIDNYFLKRISDRRVRVITETVATADLNITILDEIILISPPPLESEIYELDPSSLNPSHQFTVKYAPGANTESGVRILNTEPEHNEWYGNESRTFFYDTVSNIWRAI